MAFIGLGNPGEEYAESPHNAGHRCIDGVCDAMSVRLTRMGSTVLAKKLEWQGQQVLLAKPRTYMNESGRAVRWLSDSFSLDPADLILIFDDIDLPLGTIRIREKGSAGTHKGMKSVIQHLGHQEFPRIRIGIQPLRGPVTDIVRYVLSPVRKRDRDSFQSGVGQAVDAVITIVEEGKKKAISIFNRRPDSLLLSKRLNTQKEDK